MMSSTHVVLGGNGVIGQETVSALLRRKAQVVSVGRNPAKISAAQSATADVLQPAEVSRVLEGAAVAYFTVGLPYSARIWAEQWPVMLRNVIDASVEHGTHLVYLDNVYAYGEVDGPMTEQTAIRPTSKKGRIRAEAIAMLQTAQAERGLAITIGRCADFYGPGATTSMVNSFVINKAAAGKRCTWMLDADLPHSLSYTPDVGEALAVLGTDSSARGGTWHLPTSAALTGREWIGLATQPGARVNVMSLATLRFAGLFASAPRESIELAYQFNKPYIFDSSTYEEAFGVTPTSPVLGIEQAVEYARHHR